MFIITAWQHLYVMRWKDTTGSSTRHKQEQKRCWATHASTKPHHLRFPVHPL